MESKKKKRVLNTIMFILIAVIIVSGVMLAGNLKGWFDKDRPAEIRCKDIVGIANIERRGVGYSLKKDLAIQEQDIVETKQGSTAQLAIHDDQLLTINSSSELMIEKAAEEEIITDINNGEIFADTADISEGMFYKFAECQASAESAVYSISVQSGTASVNVYKGTVKVTGAAGDEQTVSEKESLLITKDALTVQPLAVNAMNDFLITQAQKCASADSLAFTKEELQKVLDDREAQKQAALQASINSGNYISKKDSQATVTPAAKTPTPTPSITLTPDAEDDEAEMVSGGSSENTVVVEENDDAYEEDYDDSYEDEYEDEEYDSEETYVEETNYKTCTIEIVCDTILDNMDELSAGKEAYVPANGTILATSTVEFEDGETVFDILDRVCSVAGIPLEYSWTPVYNSYYVEGINNLYEFDCGNESGWMYKVNGWFPNYGCSEYRLEDQDVIVWCYTCNGLGADVGGGI